MKLKRKGDCILKKNKYMFIFILLLLGILLSYNSSETYAAKKYKYVWRTVTTKKYLGKYKITHYCPCSRCCGKSNGITASGEKAKVDRTIAVDPNDIKLGSKVKIGNKNYVAEDTGGAIVGKKIDIFCETHAEALKRGVKYKKVWLIQRKRIRKRIKLKYI